MKPFFFSTILIAVAIITNVFAVEYLDIDTYAEYYKTCINTPITKCDTVGYCASGKSKVIAPLFIFHLLILLLSILLVDGSSGQENACRIDESKYQKKRIDVTTDAFVDIEW